MSKEMKMVDYFGELSLHGDGIEDADFHYATMSCEYIVEGVDAGDAICHAINNHDRLTDENAALREALRLKEAECEGLVKDAVEWFDVSEAQPPIGQAVIAAGGALSEPRIISLESDGNFTLWCWLNGDICEWDDYEQPTHWMHIPTFEV